MALTPPSTPPSHSSLTTNNQLSDVFSDSPPTSPNTADPSDIPRLRSTHSTAGYRAGITVSKELNLQPGFDEGYSLGAVFGLRVGYILGVLEGLCSVHALGSKERWEISQLLKEATEHLAIGKVFERQWWGEDGIWKYEVHGKDEEVTFREVVDAHPLIRKWVVRIDEEMKIAGVKVGRFEGRDWEEGRIGSGEEGLD